MLYNCTYIYGYVIVVKAIRHIDPACIYIHDIMPHLFHSGDLILPYVNVCILQCLSVCDQICQKGSYTRIVSRHTFHRHLLATLMH